jgi:hypothetical protein
MVNTSTVNVATVSSTHLQTVKQPNVLFTLEKIQKEMRWLVKGNPTIQNVEKNPITVRNPKNKE